MSLTEHQPAIDDEYAIPPHDWDDELEWRSGGAREWDDAVAGNG